ncbi:SRPBCC family protein [Mycobacterium sp. CBMA271]|uniref:SRPBCC family protein n=1 Tax=unclassified Mycobacteroides TaxID=2618759 RepID=UPI0012DECE2A|nr:MULTISPECIES: SRPBCC family protein [unclassified Mycobacteroides]MUM19771.1 polyketide cyclase [Mycobacteroides sp. CBMA 326]MUM21072.1 SRPBCC family protein [Mycobacteroides sp. CBMA 271]
MLAPRFAVPMADDSAFDSAAIVLRTRHTFDAPIGQVWAALDSDRAWSWLPFGCGVRYDEPVRRAGMEREMGTVSAPWRFLWIQRERFWRYEPPHRITYSAVAGTWPLLKLWAEDYVLTSVPGGCTLDWTVALTPRFFSWMPLRWLQPFLRVAFSWGIRPGLRSHIERLDGPDRGRTYVPDATGDTGER